MFGKRKKLEKDISRRQQMLSTIESRVDIAGICELPEPPVIEHRPEDIKYSISVGDYYRAEEEVSKYEEKRVSTFQEELLFHIFMSEMSSVAFYKKAHLDRKLFSAIKNNKDYNPQKPTAIACCLALQLNLDQTKKLLEKAGYSLSEAKRWDVIVRHCIECEYYDIDDVNYILDHFGEKPIGY